MNKSLFSGHFLAERLPHLPAWEADPAPLYAALLPLWQKAQRQSATWNEAQTEDEFVKPVLELLGWSFAVQVKSKKAGQISRPDYALFVAAAVVGEAKSRGRALSHSSQSNPPFVF